jgi:hypothetical protein
MIPDPSTLLISGILAAKDKAGTAIGKGVSSVFKEKKTSDNDNETPEAPKKPLHHSFGLQQASIGAGGIGSLAAISASKRNLNNLKYKQQGLKRQTKELRASEKQGIINPVRKKYLREARQGILRSKNWSKGVIRAGKVGAGLAGVGLGANLIRKKFFTNPNENKQ